MSTYKSHYDKLKTLFRSVWYEAMARAGVFFNLALNINRFFFSK